MTSESSGERMDFRRIALIALLLAAATLLLYAPALQNGFVSLDDPDYVTHNAHVQQGLNWTNVKWAFGTDNPASNWHPLTWISHMLDVSMYGGNAFGHHLTNVMLQAADVALLFVLLALATGEVMRSAAVGALFAVHPLNVEAVAWVAERKSVLCLLFFLAACGVYGWYTKKPSVGRYSLVVVFFALALLSKVMVVTLPVALLLLDVWPLRRFERIDGLEMASASNRPLKLVLEKVPLFLMSGAAAAMTLYVHAKEHALAGGMPLSWRVKNGVFSYMGYLGKLIWPVRLAAFYPHPENSLRWTIVILAGVVLLGITVTAWAFRRRAYLIVGWIWYLATMFPMVGFVQSGRQGMADRYMYIPMLGLLVGLVWLVGDWLSEKGSKQGAGFALVLLLTAPCAYATEKQISYWHDSYTLFTHTLAVTSRNGVAENSFGSELYERGDLAGAEQHFEAAVQFAPDLSMAHYNLATIRQRQNRAADAEREYKVALGLGTDPDELARAHNNLGVLYASAGNLELATAEFGAAIQLNAGEYNSYMGRGRIELDQQQYDKAVGDFARAANLAQSPEAFYFLGIALQRKGDDRGATDAFKVALQIAPQFKDARERLAELQSKVEVTK